MNFFTPEIIGQKVKFILVISVVSLMAGATPPEEETKETTVDEKGLKTPQEYLKAAMNLIEEGSAMGEMRQVKGDTIGDEKFQKAAEAYKKTAEALRELRADYLMKAGWFRYVTKRDERKGIKMLQEARPLRPDSGVILTMLATIEYHNYLNEETSKSLERAQQLVRLALTKTPKPVYAYWLKSQLAAAAVNNVLSTKSLKKFVDNSESIEPIMFMFDRERIKKRVQRLRERFGKNKAKE